MYKKNVRYYYVDGEPEDFKNSPLKNIFLSESEAQDLACRAAMYLKSRPATITYHKRKTKNLFAFVRVLELTRPFVSAISVSIYSGHNNVHIILHELAHTVDPYYGSHDEDFHKLFKDLIKMWNKKWHKFYKYK